MKKLQPEQHNGTEFIRLSMLPYDQMLRLKNWLSDIGIFTVQNQIGTIQNCVHYTDYEIWFDNYKSENQCEEYSHF